MITAKQVLEFHHNIRLDEEDEKLITLLMNDKEWMTALSSILAVYGVLSIASPEIAFIGCYISGFTKGLKMGRQIAEVEQLERMEKL